MSVEHELTAARARIAELEEKIQYLYRHLGIEYSSSSTQVSPKIIEAIKNGNLIEAIKIYREIHNVGLAEAKTAVESIQRTIHH